MITYRFKYTKRKGWKAPDNLPMGLLMDLIGIDEFYARVKAHLENSGGKISDIQLLSLRAKKDEVL